MPIGDMQDWLRDPSRIRRLPGYAETHSARTKVDSRIAKKPDPDRER